LLLCWTWFFHAARSCSWDWFCDFDDDSSWWLINWLIDSMQHSQPYCAESAIKLPKSIDQRSYVDLHPFAIHRVTNLLSESFTLIKSKKQISVNLWVQKKCDSVLIRFVHQVCSKTDSVTTKYEKYFDLRLMCSAQIPLVASRQDMSCESWCVVTWRNKWNMGFTRMAWMHWHR